MTKARIVADRTLLDLFNLSVSKAKTFDGCRAKYKFCYIEKLPRKEWEFQVFGKFIHEVLENFHRSLMELPDQPLHLLMTACCKKSLGNWKVTADQKQEAFDILMKYLTLIHQQKAADILPTCLAAEKEFAISIDEQILLYGFIDKVQLDPDGVIHVLDYKTSKDKSFLKKDYMQLLTYAYALCLEDPSIDRVRASYIMLRHDSEHLTKDFSREEIMKVEDLFIKYADDIRQEKLFRPSVSKLCSYCDYLEICDSGSKFVNNLNGASTFGEVSW